jgi:hypothetical protein
MNDEIQNILTNLKTIAFYLAKTKDEEVNRGLMKKAQKEKISLRNDVHDLKLSDFVLNINNLEKLIDNRDVNNTTSIRTIKVCVASSGSLAVERKEIEDFLFWENDTLVNDGIYLMYNVWEKTSSGFNSTRKQEDFNRELVYDSDIFICLIKDRVGKFTKEEFDEAYSRFISGNNPKKMYVFFQKLSEDENSMIMNDTNKFELYGKVNELKEYIKNKEQVYREFTNKDNLIRLIGNNLDKDLHKIVEF